MKQARQIFSEILDLINYPNKEDFLKTIDEYLSLELSARMLGSLGEDELKQLSGKDEKEMNKIVIEKIGTEKAASIYPEVHKDLFKRYFSRISPTLTE